MPVRRALGSGVAVLGLAILLSGCATKLAEMTITERDQQTFAGSDAIPYRVLVACREAGRDALSQKLSESIGQALIAELAKSRNVEPVFDPKGGSKPFFGAAPAPDARKLGASYELAFALKQSNLRVEGTGADGKSRYKGTLTLEASLVKTATETSVFTRLFTGESKATTASDQVKEAQPVLLEAGDDAAVQTAKAILAECVPMAIVRQTKGAGQVAMLNVGTGDGVKPEAKIEFFLYGDKGGERLIIPFATGLVIEAEDKTCWVKIANHETAGVKENHFARLAKNQTMSFFEKMNSKMGM